MPAADNYDGTALQQLVGAEVESVVFVRDYLQITLHLSQCSPRLTFNVWPSIRSADGVWRDFGDPGYRDELCWLIDGFVVRAEEAPEAGLVLDSRPASRLWCAQPGPSWRGRRLRGST